VRLLVAGEEVASTGHVAAEALATAERETVVVVVTPD
jgi:hypothetical protein